MGVALLGVVLLGGCLLFPARRTPKPESVDFVAQAQLIVPGDSVMRVSAAATNSGTLTWTLELGPCSMNIRVSAVPPAPARVWDFERWRMAVNPRAGCVGFTVRYSLPPGGSLNANELQRTARVRDVLGDSLPPGRYRVTVSVSFSNQSPLELAAGEVDLRLRR